MTTIINTETSKYQLSTLLCGMLVILCSIKITGCAAPQTAVTATSFELNSYQTAHTLKPGIAAIQMNFFTGAPALTSIVNTQGYKSFINTAYVGSAMIEGGIVEGCQVGIGGHFGLMPKVEDVGLNGSIGSSAFAKFALGESSAIVHYALIADGAFQVGNQSSAESNITTYFDSTTIWRGPFGDDRRGRLVGDSVVGWNIDLQAYRIALSLPITIQALDASVCYNIRPALHYFHTSLYGQEAIESRRVNLSKVNPISVQEHYFVPAMSFGYSIQEQVTKVDWLAFEITFAYLKSSLVLSAGCNLRVPLKL